MENKAIGSIRIKPKDDGRLYDIYLDGQEIRHVRSIDFHVDPESIPEVDLTIASEIDYNGLAEVNLFLHPESVSECVKGLRFALMTDDSLRRAFKASIKSALDEASNYEANDSLAERIFNRVVGC